VEEQIYREFLGQYLQVDPQRVYARALVDYHTMLERTATWDYEIQVLRIGPAALVGLPGEPFVEGGLRIKLASPTFPTYIVHNTPTPPTSRPARLFSGAATRRRPGSSPRLRPRRST
jgi:hypothetical protein